MNRVWFFGAFVAHIKQTLTPAINRNRKVFIEKKKLSEELCQAKTYTIQ